MPTYTIPTIGALPKRQPRGGRRRVVIVTNPGTNSLEYTGPLQVFAEANFFLGRSGRPDLGYDIEFTSSAAGTIYDDNGLKIVIEKSYADVTGPVDTLIFQAVDEQETCVRDERFLRWVARMATRVRRIASVCVGTFVLAEAGVLDGRRATTHWAACEDFAKRFPNVALEPDPIFVKDGNVYTSAGGAAGFDLALALVEEDFGAEVARRAAQGLVMYLRRPGNQAQFSVHLSAKSPKARQLQALQAYIAENLDGDLCVETLAARAGMSPRNFARVFAREFSATPGRFVEQLRLERARHFLEQTDMPVGQVADRCGYRSPDGLRLAFNTNLSVSPMDYRRRFATTRRATADEIGLVAS